MRRSLALTLVLAAARLAVAGAQGTEKETLPGARNYTRVDATVACAGATDPAAFAELKRRGFTSVVNFRTGEEAGANVEIEAEAVKQAGLKYFHLPFQASAPTREVADRFLKVVVDPANQPVYIHCASANRVGGMWLIKRVLVDRWDEGRAIAEAEAIGLSTPALKQFALDYIAAHKR